MGESRYICMAKVIDIYSMYVRSRRALTRRMSDDGERMKEKGGEGMRVEVLEKISSRAAPIALGR